MMSVVKNSNGWVFTPLENFLVFWLPIPAVILSWSFLGKGTDLLTFSLYILAVKIPFEMGHVLATAYPLLQRTKDGRLSNRKFYLGCLGVFIVSSLLLHISQVTFYILLTFIALLHICRQQHGWVMLSRRQAQEPDRDRWFDSLMVTNVMLVPLIWWQSELGPEPKFYFFPNNIHLSIDATVATFAMTLHWFINVIYTFNISRKILSRKAVNWGKISIIVSTWIWFYTSLVMFESRQIFLAELVLIHGIAYVVYSYKSSKKEETIAFKSQPQFFLKLLSHPWTYTIFFVFTGGLWFLYVRKYENILFVNPGNMLEVIFWMPLLLHYYFDSIIWRKNFFKTASSTV